jgi:hypothetical protein
MYTDCKELEKGYPTKDGYLRLLDKPRKEGGKLKMVHRMEWEKVNGLIPDGYEINHKCKNRRCYNVDHLECISRSEHRSKDNSERYKQRRDQVAKFLEENPDLTQRYIGKLFGIAQATVSRIKKDYCL